MLSDGEHVVKTGTFLDDGTVECDLRIVHEPIRFGSGDCRDPPELQEDVIADTYVVQ